MKRYEYAWRWPVIASLVVMALLVVACDAQTSALPPTERLEIETMVEDYFSVANPPAQDLPKYEARVEAVVGNWARVELRPADVENAEPNLFYLERRDIDPNTPNQTPHGWTIVLGPQVHYTESELDSAGVPKEVRP